jgi:putative serine protease PepD
MNRRLLPLAAAGLIAVGAIGDHVLNLGQKDPGAAAATATTTRNSGIQAATAPVSVSASTSTSIDAAIQNAYAVASRSVVYVSNVGIGSGSGIIYDSKGDILTNNHVVDQATKITVTLNDGRVIPATLVGTDRTDDLAVIRIHTSGLTPARFAAAGTYHVAQTVLAIGSPVGLKQSVSSGLISGLHRVEQEPSGAYLPDALQTSAAINPGNSGGALVTLDGAVVGIPTLVQTSTTSGTATQNIGFAVPSERAVLVAKQIIATGKVEHTGRAFLGIAPTDSSGGQSSSPFGIGQDPNGSAPTVAGALVSHVSSNGPAGKAGIQQGDVITSVNGLTVNNAQDLLTVLAQKKPGNTISLKLNRNGSTISVTVRLAELPA